MASVKIIHWSGLYWHKKKVRAKYRREEARWWKEYYSLDAQSLRHRIAKARV